jgi:hypothetical protein
MEKGPRGPETGNEIRLTPEQQRKVARELGGLSHEEQQAVYALDKSVRDGLLTGDRRANELTQLSLRLERLVSDRACATVGIEGQHQNEAILGGPDDTSSYRNHHEPSPA